jgi:Thrombospondin type 3 repeat
MHRPSTAGRRARVLTSAGTSSARAMRRVSGILLVLLPIVATPAAAAPSLTGEVLSRHTSYGGPTSGLCTVDPGTGSTSYSFNFAGTASGPYPGTFTEQVQATIGPAGGPLAMGLFPDGFSPGVPNPSQFVMAGQLLSLTASFTINSPAGNVTGTKTLTAVVPADSTHAGACREWVDQPVPPFGTLNGAYKDVRAFGATYEATITTPAGSFPDEGRTNLQARQGEVSNQGGPLFDVDDLGARFDSRDDDGDGVLDTSDNCPTVANPTQVNADGDSLGDACDPDDDNDGVPDTGDACPTQAAATANGCPTPPPPSDRDGDGTPDAGDNCPDAPNPDQANVDGDGLGDACDPDDDNDGVPDGTDGCPTAAAATANGCPDTSGPSVPGKAKAKLAGRALRVRLGSFAEDVTGTVAVKSRPLKKSGAVKRIKLGPKPFQARAGKTLSVKFKLSRRVLAAVRRLGRVKLSVTVKATDVAGNTTTRRVSVTLKAKRA